MALKGERDTGSRADRPRQHTRLVRSGPISEHSGLDAQVFPFLVWPLFLLCEITGGELQPRPETSEVAFFADDKLPADLSTACILVPQIRRMFEHKPDD